MANYNEKYIKNEYYEIGSASLIKIASKINDSANLNEDCIWAGNDNNKNGESETKNTCNHCGCGGKCNCNCSNKTCSFGKNDSEKKKTCNCGDNCNCKKDGNTEVKCSSNKRCNCNCGDKCNCNKNGSTEVKCSTDQNCNKKGKTEVKCSGNQTCHNGPNCKNSNCNCGGNCNCNKNGHSAAKSSNNKNCSFADKFICIQNGKTEVKCSGSQTCSYGANCSGSKNCSCYCGYEYNKNSSNKSGNTGVNCSSGNNGKCNGGDKCDSNKASCHCGVTHDCNGNCACKKCCNCGTSCNNSQDVVASTSHAKRPHQLAMDLIRNSLKHTSGSARVLLMLIPGARHCNYCQLHMIDRSNNEHLGMSVITLEDLKQLCGTKIFEDCNVVIGTKPIDLKGLGMKTPFIADLMNKICDEKALPHKERRVKRKTSHPLKACLPIKRVVKFDSSAVKVRPLERLPLQRVRRSIRSGDKRSAGSARKSSRSMKKTIGKRILALINAINQSTAPTRADLDTFFALAEQYKITFLVRPALGWPGSSPHEGPLVNVDCYMAFENYVGSIRLNSDTLQRQLNKHKSILSRISVVKDVCETMPVPRRIFAGLFRLSTWLGIELLYDACGEFLFKLYKRYT